MVHVQKTETVKHRERMMEVFWNMGEQWWKHAWKHGWNLDTDHWSLEWWNMDENMDDLDLDDLERWFGFDET